MSTPRRKSDFLGSEEGKEIKRSLERMALDSTYNTTSTYSVNSTLYPDSLIPFVDKHMNYLMDHPKLEASQYLSNLRLMIRVR